MKATKVMSATKDKVTRIESKPSTFQRTQELLRELNLDRREWQKETKLRNLFKAYELNLC